VAFAIGRRVGSAVTRNRVRRRLRAAVASHASLLTPGAAYLVGAGQQAASWDYATLESALGDLLAEAHSENLR
jgi:ribonuclease P protein component